MDLMVGADEIESLRVELSEIGRSLRSSFRQHTSSFRSSSALSSVKDDADVDYAQQWAAIERLPTFERLRSSLFDQNKGKQVVDVTKLGDLERRLFVEKLIKHIELDNLKLLWKIRKRIDKADVKLPTIEVRYKNLRVEAECRVVKGKPLPTLWTSLSRTISGVAKLSGFKPHEARLGIINDVNGIVKPGRIHEVPCPVSILSICFCNLHIPFLLMTLLLGPPGCGKTSLLKALSGNLDPSLKVSGEVSYNGYKLGEFVPHKTSAYISQYDLHIAEMTVRETLNFSARCQGVGSRAEIMMEVNRREKEARILPDPDIDTYMKAIAVKGLKTTLQTDYILKILGLDICADTLVGNSMRRGISGGQKKRLTTGSSTAFQIVTCLQQLAHITDATALVSLLQPAPETFNLFDDIILMAEGRIVYHGPRDNILQFFENCGFRCPVRKGVADFIQEVISKKDQAQYWHHTEQPYGYVSVVITMTLFLRTRMAIDVSHGMYYMGALFYSLVIFLVEGVPELSMTVSRLEVFYKQKELRFYPAWAYTIPTAIVRIPLCFVEVLVWTSLTYYVIGYSPEASRFFCQVILLLALHFALISMFRFLASIFQTADISLTAGSFAMLLSFLFGGFVIAKPSMPVWLKWGFWVSPLSYAEIGLSVNEFLAPRRQRDLSTNTTIGRAMLESRGLNFDGYFFWISLGALAGFALIFNIGFTLALSILKSPGSSRAIISQEELSRVQGREDSSNDAVEVSKYQFALPPCYFYQKETHNSMSLQNFVKFLKETSVEERGRKSSALSEGLCRQFSLAELQAATNNFDGDLKIGKGGSGSVYKGLIDGGSLVVAVRRLSGPSSGPAVKAFRNEVQLLCQLRHQNLVCLLGFCHEKDERIIVYEHMTHGGLDGLLLGNVDPLPWKRRLEICIGAARGLHYLHTGAKYAIIHRDIKSHSILLNENWDAKFSYFGLSNIGPSSISKPKPNAFAEMMTSTRGTLGYMAPENFMRGHELSEKVDVFSLGVVLLEVLCGGTGRIIDFEGEPVGLISGITECIKNGCVHNMIDPFLKGKIAPVCLIEYVQIALNCVHLNPNERPSMGEVEVTLELALKLQEKADLVIKAVNPHAGYSYEDVSFRVSDEEIQNWQSYSYCFGGDWDAGSVSDVEMVSEGGAVSVTES
ncbi:hypothetical protein SLEP1_g27677 [Rubroshorea leprosula]|uniref:Protein kinase domain-containing protein n=1 Tax=Rubroshorea leprosula TaxID=152421 RepID=A0AAV5JY94_9ROSI|nr:hypothetical protein SLEP1_g27677 [Rubroshorea leprosula]